MGMGQKHMGNVVAVGDEGSAKVLYPGAGIQNETMISRPHLDATGVAAVFHVAGGRTGDASAHTPEFQF